MATLQSDIGVAGLYPLVKLKSWENFTEWEHALLEYAWNFEVQWAFNGSDLSGKERDYYEDDSARQIIRLQTQTAKAILLHSLDGFPHLTNKWKSLFHKRFFNNRYFWRNIMREITNAVMKDWGKTREDLFADLGSLVANGAESVTDLLSKMDRVFLMLELSCKTMSQDRISEFVCAAVKTHYPEYLKLVRNALIEHELSNSSPWRTSFRSQYPIRWVMKQIERKDADEAFRRGFEAGRQEWLAARIPTRQHSISSSSSSSIAPSIKRRCSSPVQLKESDSSDDSSSPNETATCDRKGSFHPVSVKTDSSEDYDSCEAVGNSLTSLPDFDSPSSSDEDGILSMMDKPK